jgi:hypothetical protein
MSQKETSGVPQDASLIPPTVSAAPGGPSEPDIHEPVTTIPSPPHYSLRFLIALITKTNQFEKK